MIVGDPPARVESDCDYDCDNDCDNDCEYDNDSDSDCEYDNDSDSDRGVILSFGGRWRYFSAITKFCQH